MENESEKPNIEEGKEATEQSKKEIKKEEIIEDETEIIPESDEEKKLE